MQKTDEQQHHDCITRFIDLANELARDGIPNRVVAAGLMTASGIFSTYIVLGNSGRLDDSGVEKITGVYREQLQLVQQHREQRDIKEKENQVADTVERIVSFPEE